MQRILSATAQAILQRERELFASLERIATRLEASDSELRPLIQGRRQIDQFFLLVVVGEFNSGKSAFINTLLGQRFLDEGVLPTTSQVHLLTYGPAPAAEQLEPFLLRVTYPVDWLQEINIVDTPGTNAVIRRHQEITETFVPRSDLVLFVTSADRPFSESERAFLQLVRDWGKKVVVVINKIDILENEAAIQQVVDFVRNQAAAVLGSVPQVFPVSVRLAQRARFGEVAAAEAQAESMALSRFPALESYILKQLDQHERLRLKLESPLGVAGRMHAQFQGVVSDRIRLLQEDRATLDGVDAQLDAYTADMHHDFRFRLTKIENILHDLRQRGDLFFEETIRVGRFLDLINAARLRAEFERQVVADTHGQIETEVSGLIDWMVERNYRQWQDITTYLNRRAAQYSDRLVGNVGGAFEFNRQKLLQSVGRTARDVTATYDKSAEAQQLSESVQGALTAIGAVEVGAIGLGAILLHVLTRALDPLGILAAGGLAVAGLFILPARRRAAKNDLNQKIETLRQRLVQTMTAQFERELALSMQEMREAVAPYTRFIRVEHQKLSEMETQLEEAGIELQQLRGAVAALQFA